MACSTYGLALNEKPHLLKHEYTVGIEKRISKSIKVELYKQTNIKTQFMNNYNVKKYPFCRIKLMVQFEVWTLLVLNLIKIS